MAKETDIAREFGFLCQSLKSSSGQEPGDEYLARVFEVEPWSEDFFRCVHAIFRQAKDLETVIQKTSMDEDLKQRKISHVGSLSAAFSKGCLIQPWSNLGIKYLDDTFIESVLSLSPYIRQHQVILSLDEIEREELIQETSKFRDWLLEAQLAENDFIRGALINGLENFLFCLKHIKWIGWPYALSQTREIITAYLAIHGMRPESAHNPDAAIVLSKCGSLIRKIGRLVRTANDYKGDLSFLYLVYEASSAPTVQQGITALLASP